MSTKIVSTQLGMKDSYFQMWRGICIAAVVLIHCHSVSINWNTFDGVYYFIERNAVNFPVALFFVLSGYFVKQSSFVGESCKGTIISRVKKLIIPYLVYTFLYMIFDVLLGREISVSYVLKAIFFGQSATPLYYVLVLLLFTLITPVLLKCIQKKSLSLLVFVFSVLTLAVFYLVEFNGYSIWFYTKYTIVWLPFYYFGILVRNSNINIEKLKKASMFCVVGGFLLELVESVQLLSVPDMSEVAMSQIRVFAFVYAFFLAILMFSNHKPVSMQTNGLLKRIFVYLGDNSYGIYFIHFFYIIVAEILISKLQVLFELPLPVYHIGEFITVILFSLVSIKVLRLVFKKTGSLIFGV